MMNKKEQAEFASLKRQLLEAKAFRLTEEVKPDIPAPVYGEKDKRGWHAHTFLNTSFSANPSLSSTINHGVGIDKYTVPPRTTTQRKINQYSTRLLALKAARNELEQKMIKILADIDQEIQDEIENPTLQNNGDNK